MMDAGGGSEGLEEIGKKGSEGEGGGGKRVGKGRREVKERGEKERG